MLEIIKKPWFFVLTGVVMTVFSAVITNFFIVENNDAIEKTRMKIMSLDRKIDQTWQNSKDVERLEETGTMLLLLSEMADNDKKKAHSVKGATRYFEKVIRTGTVNPSTAKKIRDLIEAGKISEVLDALFKIIDNNKISSVNSINDYYIEKAALERQKIGMEDRNSTLRNIALFLQIMGLILVLSNGLIRAPDLPT